MLGRALLLLPLLLASCAGGTETGNPPGVAEVGFALTTSDPRVASTTQGEGEVFVEAAWASIAHLQLTPCDASNEAYDVIDAPALFDLTSGLGLGLGQPALDYCGVQLTFVPATTDMLAAAPQAPHELGDRSLALLGQRSGGVPLRVISQGTPSIALSTTGGHDTLDAAGTLLVAFDLATWFSTLDLDAASVTDGALVIDPSTNVDLLTTFDNHLVDGVSLHIDSDGDGLLDPDERDAIAP